jgi:hypothetical protein
MATNSSASAEVQVGWDKVEVFGQFQVVSEAVSYDQNDRTERRGRPCASALSTDVARPRSLQ